jgi:hypothetical protein
MLLLLGSRGDLYGEAVNAGRRVDGQRHVAKARLRTTSFGWGILGGGLRTARGERDEGER